MDVVNQLKVQRRITGQPLTLDKLVDPLAEQEIGQGLDLIKLGDLEIVQMVQVEADLARGDIEEIDSEPSDDGPDKVPPSLKEMFEEKSMLVCAEGAFEIVQAVLHANTKEIFRS